VIQRLAAGFGGFQSDGELFFGFGLADELAQLAGAQFEFKSLLFVSARGADQPFRSVVAGDGHAEEKCSRCGASRAKSSWPPCLPSRRLASAENTVVEKRASSLWSTY